MSYLRRHFLPLHAADTAAPTQDNGANKNRPMETIIIFYSVEIRIKRNAWYIIIFALTFADGGLFLGTLNSLFILFVNTNIPA